MIALSCGIKISAVRHLVVTIHASQTDGQTDGRTDKITSPKTALTYARAVKTGCVTSIFNTTDNPQAYDNIIIAFLADNF